ncbi:CotS family spore coat protein [Haloimpatiens sp. FM7330]|uniref:CotS family spore coat protein n=1 Tax=Haloimpatiens sp. FM7330 TaxID=3298610 RepID=UPI00362DCD3E
MDRSVEYISEINSKEEHMIKNILTRYKFDVIQISKVRSVYKIKTNKGYICLKKIKHGKGKAENGSKLVEELKKNNFLNTPDFIKTKDNNLFIKYRKVYFYATEWIDGKECNLNDINEAIKCVQLLAKFHIASTNINLKYLKIKNNLKKWPKIFNKKLYEMDRFKKCINNKKLKNQFDIKYYKYINSFYHRGLAALSLLNSSSYYKVSKLYKNKKTICHNSFYYQNIIKKDNKYYIIDLDSVIIDLPINDLGKLIRRLMFKKNYKWDFNKVKKMIKAYTAINPLTKEELEIMLSLIIFPHKFWKMGKKRYVKHKGWSEIRYMRKLNKLIEHDSLQESFMNDYLQYLRDIED